MPAEAFVCIECDRQVVRVCGPDFGRLCAACIMVPGWFRSWEMRALIDPTHDGRERRLDATARPAAP